MKQGDLQSRQSRKIIHPIQFSSLLTQQFFIVFYIFTEQSPKLSYLNGDYDEKSILPRAQVSQRTNIDFLVQKQKPTHIRSTYILQWSEYKLNWVSVQDIIAIPVYRYRQLQGLYIFILSYHHTHLNIKPTSVNHLKMLKTNFTLISI